MLILSAGRERLYFGIAVCNGVGERNETKKLFMKSFDSTTAVSAMNSKWSDKKGCAVKIEMSPKAAAFLNLGSSPFIVKDGEDKLSRKKAGKGTIRRGNLKPEDIGYWGY